MSNALLKRGNIAGASSSSSPLASAPVASAPAAVPPRRQWHARPPRADWGSQRRPVGSVRQHGGSRCCGAVKVHAWDSLASVDDEELGWRTDFGAQYVHGRLLGQGSFGNVYLGVSLHTGKEVAVKVLPKVRGKLTREKTLEKLAREVDVLERLQPCPGVVRIDDVFEDADAVSIVTELCSGGDLQRYFEAHGSLDERALAHVAFEVLKIVQACHEAGLLHGDVKPANFCLKHPTHNPLVSPQVDFASPSAPAWLKAIDFGCSQELSVHRRLTKRTGTPVYMAPETYQRDYHREADVWSVGVMLYQLFARRFPFWDSIEGCKAAAFDEVAHAVATADIRFGYGPWLHMSAQGRAFVSACLQRCPSERLTVQEALQHPWLARWVAGPALPLHPAAPASLPQQPQVVQQHVGKVRPTGRPMPAGLVPAGPTPYQQCSQLAGAWSQLQQQQGTVQRLAAQPVVQAA